MSLVCEFTGKGRLKANKISHSNIKTRRFKFPNIVRKSWFIPELSRSLTLTLSSQAFRTIAKRGGFVNALMEEREENLSERLLGVRRQIEKLRRSAAPKKPSKPQEPAQDKV